MLLRDQGPRCLFEDLKASVAVHSQPARSLELLRVLFQTREEVDAAVGLGSLDLAENALVRALKGVGMFLGC